MRRTHSPTEYGFQFFFATLEEALEFQVYQTNNEIQYVQIDGSIPFYDRAGNVRYPSINDKLNQPQLDFVNEGDGVEKLATRVELDEELFVLLNPGMRLVQVVAVRITNRRLTKL